MENGRTEPGKRWEYLPSRPGTLEAWSGPWRALEVFRPCLRRAFMKMLFKIRKPKDDLQVGIEVVALNPSRKYFGW